MSHYVRGKSISGYRFKLKPTPANHPLLATAKEVWNRQITQLAAQATVQVPGVKAADLALEDLHLVDLFPGIQDQGQEGACTGFSEAQNREVRYGSANGKIIPFRLAPAYPYAKARQAEGTFPADVGSNIADGFSVLYAMGICPEADLPYDPSNPALAPNELCDTAAREFRIGMPAMADIANTDHFKLLINNGIPISIAILCYQSFENCPGSGILTVPDQSKEALIGGHGLLIIGYTTINGVLYALVVNQWGKSFGKDGFCYMPLGTGYPITEAWAAPTLPASI